MRKRAAGLLCVEQSRDLATINRLIVAAGFDPEDKRRPAACYLVAWIGDRAVGTVALETEVDAALLRCLSVDAGARGKGVGAALIAAARKAARTRGACAIYAFAPGDALRRFGFEPAAASAMAAALESTAEIREYRGNPARFAALAAWRLDISRDGVIVR